MSPPLTVVIYHYVRDAADAVFPQLPGLSTEAFEGQLDYLERHHELLDPNELVARVREGRGVPEGGCLLTFDDGLVDHLQTVLPRLLRRGLKAAFFAPTSAVLDRALLDVHKVHFIIRSGTPLPRLHELLLEELDRHRPTVALPSREELYARYQTQLGFDAPPMGFVKRLLQFALPEQIRSTVVQALFEKAVGEDPRAFADRFYLTTPDLKALVGHGMLVGGHGDRHQWLGTLGRADQERDLRRTRELLAQVYGAAPEGWVESYPNGSYDQTTLELLPRYGAALAFTSRPQLADLSRPYELDRLDTNDLPRAGDAPLSDWTRKARAEGDSARSRG